jgi:membrane protein YdbS with pleckstrin-like domain
VDGRGCPARACPPAAPTEKQRKKAEAIMRIGSVVLIIWLIIGLIAAAQRNYFNEKVSCASAGTVIVTILAGPLNYVGVNPKLSCH